jgi:3-deoxy-D-manno-octulosonate 8-phosphate phosphatase (KDO 8-P phosphatase)
VDARADESLLLAPLRSVPLALWPLRGVMAAAGGTKQVVAVTRSRSVAAMFKRHGVSVVASPPDGRGAMRLDPLRPFASDTTLRRAFAAECPDLVLMQRSVIESIEVRDDAMLELARAVAAGLPPGHACLKGVARLRLPLPLRVRAVICDVDGTLTDGGIGFDDGAHAFRTFNTHDGLGTRHLIEAGIKVAWLSATSSGTSIERRAVMLGVHAVDAGAGPKGRRLIALCKRLGVAPRNAVYLGDDVNDLPAMKAAGASACPADARPEVRAFVDLVLDTPGGRGALRELADIILAER